MRKVPGQRARNQLSFMFQLISEPCARAFETCRIPLNEQNVRYYVGRNSTTSQLCVELSIFDNLGVIFRIPRAAFRAESPLTTARMLHFLTSRSALLPCMARTRRLCATPRPKRFRAASSACDCKAGNISLVGYGFETLKQMRHAVHVGQFKTQQFVKLGRAHTKRQVSRAERVGRSRLETLQWWKNAVSIISQATDRILTNQLRLRPWRNKRCLNRKISSDQKGGRPAANEDANLLHLKEAC